MSKCLCYITKKFYHAARQIFESSSMPNIVHRGGQNIYAKWFSSPRFVHQRQTTTIDHHSVKLSPCSTTKWRRHWSDPRRGRDGSAAFGPWRAFVEIRLQEHKHPSSAGCWLFIVIYERFLFFWLRLNRGGTERIKIHPPSLPPSSSGLLRPVCVRFLQVSLVPFVDIRPEDG